MEYEAVIGLEIHVQLKTRSKVFAGVATGFGEPPNELIDPTVLALPGALPVLNRESVEKSIKFGLMIDAKIPKICRWSRKNYFYPDSPKNYQITQLEKEAVVGAGAVEIELPGPARNIMGEHKFVRINHAHLEEDVGKLTHEGAVSLVDYNRAGTTLLEIVTEPDMHSAEEAVALLNALRMILATAGISDCDMEKGQLRCDANVSVRPKGSSELRTRTEMKNVNSLAGVRNCINFEIKRQVRTYESGEQVVQETRGWNADTGHTYSMRSKENAHDYRYFPDPDLMPVKIDDEWLARLKKDLPERPFDRQRRYMETLNLPYSTTSVFVPNRELCEYFESALAAYDKNPSLLANLVANEVLREISSGKHAFDNCPIPPKNLAELVKITDEGVISKQLAKDVFAEMWASGKSAAAIVAEKGLAQNFDSGELEKIVAEIVANPKNADAVAAFKGGSERVINVLKGQVMKASKGKANPAKVDEILRRLLA
ncbi:MAG: Asp-tRNA(Asn)/Glu-tRNA(Gln) amidotransferase subunit GatB [Opitutae bacterium]|nr:Asp-tRNA(Asn)/Glu-tRNA(Gln) amidotransferase subunit GatB [Opitutae bacterium]MCD8299416.1 Asp-tRNA(Asn)/Glu-tRNA(Gln) amidotransferase subunit GatB [Opitutae bacterium]